MLRLDRISKDPFGYAYSNGRIWRLEFMKFCYSHWYRLIWKFKNVKFGTGLIIVGKTYLYRCPNSTIKLGENVAFISDKTSNLIGLMRNCIVSTLVKDAQIIIGDNSGFSGVSIGAAKKINIGSNVVIGANCLITDTNWHNISPEMRHLGDPNPGEISIGDNVFIGYGCIILKNVTIGENSVIGAGSVVTRSIPPNVIAAGNPCHIINDL